MLDIIVNFKIVKFICKLVITITSVKDTYYIDLHSKIKSVEKYNLFIFLKNNENKKCGKSNV